MKFLAFGDTHYPYQDDEAIAVLKAAVRKVKPDVTVCLGDGADCEVFSKHPSTGVQEKQYSYLNNEIKPLNALLDHMQKFSKKLVYIEGNHEQRISRWCGGLGRAGEEIFELLNPKGAISQDRKNFKWVPAYSYYQIAPGLVAVHGWSYCRHAAAKHLDMSKTKSIIFGHTHRRQFDCARDSWTGTPIQSESAGCLCKFQPIYNLGGAPNAWVHGFIIGHIVGNNIQTNFVQINGKSCILPDGTLIKP